MNDQINIVIYIEEGGLQEEAFALSQKTGIPISDTPGEALTLLFDASGFSLVGYGMRYQGDFEQMLYRVSSGRLHHEMLVKAAKTKSEHPVAFDATAGMGEDAFLLAAMGYEVVLFEQNPIVAALLQDAMSRARRHPDLRVVINRMKLIHGDSIALMPTLEVQPELVYLDPMFPARRKSGLIGKKLQLIQKLEQPCASQEELLAAALSLHPKKIVIKRPLNGAFLAEQKPSYTLKGRAIRYDVIVP